MTTAERQAKASGSIFSWPSAILNQQTMMLYCMMLEELAYTMFKWENLPPNIDGRFIERTLFFNGRAAFYNDPVLGNTILPFAPSSALNEYGDPVSATITAQNGYNYHIDNPNDFVPIYNNYSRTGSYMGIMLYARRIADIERSIDVNVQACKNPTVYVCANDADVLKMKNLHQKTEGNESHIFMRAAEPDNVKLLRGENNANTFLGDKLGNLKRQFLSEAMTYLGITNNPFEKAERLISSEVEMAGGGTNACRRIRLKPRMEAAKRINARFGTNISVKEDVEAYGEVYNRIARIGGNDGGERAKQFKQLPGID